MSAHGQAEKSPAALRPFLEEFRAHTAPPVIGESVSFAGVAGKLHGYVARPRQEEPLPALLLIPDEAGLDAWLQDTARDLAGIGYVVLAIDLDQRAAAQAASGDVVLAELSTAVRWLRRRADVSPERIGVVGWGRGGELALGLAATTSLQACATCYGALPVEAAVVSGLRTTPLLTISAGGDRRLSAFQKAVAAAGMPHQVRIFEGCSAGFMRPQSAAYSFADAEDAWVALYNFLGRYVEDADENGPKFGAGEQAKGQPRSFASIADLMRAVMAPTGMRGALSKALQTAPTSEQQWKTVRAQAAMLAEVSQLLEQRRPQKGTLGHWQEQVRALQATTENLLTAADQRDHPAASRAFVEVAERCALCHEQHR